MATQVRDTVSRKSAGSGGSAGRSRTSPAVFVREVAAELRKVIWPTKKELVTYTTVALVFIMIMVGIVSGLDYVFTKLMLSRWLFG